MNTITDRFILDEQAMIRQHATLLSTQMGGRGFDNEKQGQIDAETVVQVLDAGIMKMGVPRRYGGLEVDYEMFPEISLILGRACLATSWTIGILLQHNMQMGLFPEEAQDEFWAKGPNTFAPGFIIPGGTARSVPGGYRLSGHWRFGSGYPLGDWILLSAHELVDGEKKQVRRFALPRADTTPQNNWKVSGLSASSTWDCLLDDVFVPEHRSMPASSMLDGSAPGLRVNVGATWRIPMLSFYYPNMAAMVLGAAQGVAHQVLERMKGRTLAYGGAQAADLGYMRANTARGFTELNAAEALLKSHATRIGQTARNGDRFEMIDRAAVRADCTWVVKTARRTAQELCDQAGTSAFFLSSELQRFHREISVMSSHSFYDADRMYDVYGKALFGQAIPAGELI
jgi:3-hydroxy-9,10-secoandrosta-1,3,5(10)-triene-9,17-dione monooxygenase